jgi:hypothetical protein
MLLADSRAFAAANPTAENLPENLPESPPDKLGALAQPGENRSGAYYCTCTGFHSPTGSGVAVP